MNTSLLAHGLLAHSLGEWTWEPFTIVLLLVSAGLYAAGLRALWARAGIGAGVKRWEAVAYFAGLATIAVALLSPLAWLSDILFSAHMAQHEILMIVSAPLLVFGRPLFVCLWAVAPQRREAAGAWTRRAAVSGAWRAVSAPLVVFVLHAAALWIWHLPSLYEAALANQGIHAVQHASFLLTAALFWWAMVHGRYGRIGYGLGVLYVFLTAVHSSILGALLTVAPTVWYPSYVAAATQWRLDPLADQQLAGLLMWVPSGLIFIVFGLALLAAWLGEAERRARLGSVANVCRE